MGDVRVVPIGGTSNVGKSAVAQVVAERLGFACRSTATLTRHPGRPWHTPGWEVPERVAEHYRTLTVDELIASVLDHYARLWPRIEELITEHATGRGGLVLDLGGRRSGPRTWRHWPSPRTAAVWLTVEDTVVRARVHRAGHYPEASAEERRLMEKFLARSARYQSLMRAELTKPALDTDTAHVVDAGGGRSVTEVAVAVSLTPRSTPSTAPGPGSGWTSVAATNDAYQ